jgi:hypothetical protein
MATIEELREYVKQRALLGAKAVTSPGMARIRTAERGAFINGPDLQKAAEYINAFPDKVGVKKILGLFGAVPKYQALEILLSEVGEYYPKAPELVQEIVAKATEIDRELEPPKRR